MCKRLCMKAAFRNEMLEVTVAEIQREVICRRLYTKAAFRNEMLEVTVAEIQRDLERGFVQAAVH